MNSFLELVFLQNSIKSWLIALVIMLLIMLTARVMQQVVLTRIRRFADKTSSTLDDFMMRLVERTAMPMLYFIAVYAASRYLNKSEFINKIIQAIFITVIVFFVVRAIGDLFSYIFQRFTNSDHGQLKQAKGILLIIKIMLWLGGAVFLLDNLGYDITTIVTGLGIGGIAIALAAQAVLADLFSYLVIFFDKPFEVGDFIQTGDKSGVVEYIGIKTTRLRTLSGEQLIMSNTDLTNSRVQNFKRMEKRRVVLSIGVTYETGSEKLKMIPAIIQEIIGQLDEVQFDRAHFSEFGDFSLNFELVYYLMTSDYLKHMDIQQRLLFCLYERFENEQIEFAYPTQRLLFQTEKIWEGADGKNLQQ